MLDATPLLRLYARRRLAGLRRQDPGETQKRQLLKLVRQAKDTRFGRDHRFSGIDSVEAYQERVPLRRYEDHWEQYWKGSFPRLDGQTWPGHIPYLAVTSGTSSGRTKYIPVSRQMARSNTSAGIDLLVHHLERRPQSRILGGSNFMLSGTVDLKDEGHGVVSGDLSGIARREAPRWAQSYIFPDYDLAREGDWERKMEEIGRASIGQPIRTIAGTPSWLLLFFERMRAITGRTRLIDLYPGLEMIAHGGVAFAPYRQAFADWLEGSGAELREVYPASEGFVALADRGPGEGLRMLLDNGLFFEFVPTEQIGSMEPDRRWIGNVEEGRDYALVLTSNAGLWSYVLGDTVRIVDRDPPRLLVTGRTSYFLSAFGEHLTGEEIEAAVLHAATDAALQVNEYAAGAIYPDGSDARGRHVFIIEPRWPPPSHAEPAALAEAIDRHLSGCNDDYATHRGKDFGMAAPEVILVEPGSFADWMNGRGKLGGQNKVPRVINDGELFAGLLRFAQERTIARHRA